MAPILSLSEAIRETVRDGDTIALEGFTHLIPFAAGHEIIRQAKRNLTVIRMTPDALVSWYYTWFLGRVSTFLATES